MYNVLSSQQSKYLLKSSNDFSIAFNEANQELEKDFVQLPANDLFSTEGLSTSSIDFILEQNQLNPELLSRTAAKAEINLGEGSLALKEFVKNNPSAYIKVHKLSNGRIVYYGRLLTDSFLNSISQKINAQVALISGNSALQVSNEKENQKYIYNLNKAYSYLAQQDKFTVYSEESAQADIICTLSSISSGFEENQNLHFLIFSNLSEAEELRTSITYLLVTVSVAGVFLSLILTFLLTRNIRHQLYLLGKATELTKQGNFKNRIELKSNDEIGSLASAFNSMLEELDEHDREMNDYTDFIALINRNASLKEIADAALNKIIKTCSFTIGAIYGVKENSIYLIRSYGMKGKTEKEDFEFFANAINKREMHELYFEKNYPTVSTGIVSLEIKHMLVVPIIYNNEVIALIELGGLDKPSEEVKRYLSKIQEQLAIGLTNAFALVQLENLVVELKLLNEEYQKQNEQVKQQNESLLRLHNELKTKAHELEIQKQRAEEATKLKSQFLASMSHELRTPMNSVLGLTELILDESSSLSLKTKERLEIVHKSGKRLMNLINDILDLSKIEAGKMELKSDEIVLEDIIYDVDASIRPLAVKKHLEFRITRKSSTNIQIRTDRGKVTQVLINLLGNAIKFTEHGFVELDVNITPSSQLKFNVIDSGIGISTQDQKVIFEEFRQLDGTTTRKYGGTGLGLSICKRIAEMLDGSLTVESNQNTGSVFSFIIPLKLSLGKKETTHSVNVGTLAESTKNSILVIDADTKARNMIGEYFESRGYEVLFADNGASGVRLAKELQPAAITLDLLLPNNDGWNVLKELKESVATKNIPVIMISINNDKNIGYGVSAFDYFIKPGSQRDLTEIIIKIEDFTRKKIEKVAFVDKDEKELERLKPALEKARIKTQLFNNSEFAVDGIISSLPDLVIIDLLMAGKDGISLIHELKIRRETKNIPLILAMPAIVSEEEKYLIKRVVDEIALRLRNHPLDVLKIVRDRIKMDEITHLYHDLSDPQTTEPGPDIKSAFDGSAFVETADYKNKKMGTVLIVDDDHDTLFTLKEIIQSCNCITMTAQNGLECLAALEEKIPDLIMLDIMMPEMDGFQTIKKIRENPNWRHIPVLAVTARAMLEDRQIILKNGFDDYITKPVNIGVISFKIEKLFSKLNVK
jgi:signal transduction histidine kinase/DNA-binding response OmpR family regulator